MRAGSNDYHADLIREQERMRGEEKRGEPRGRRNYNSSGEFPKGFIDGGVAPAHTYVGLAAAKRNGIRPKIRPKNHPNS